MNYTTDDYTTFALCFNTYKLSDVKSIEKKQVSSVIVSAFQTYNSSSVKSAFDYGRKIFTYEEFMMPETKDVIAAMSKLLDILK